NNGTLTIDKATVSDNYASSFLAAGGGISNFGRLTIDGCTVSNNYAPGGAGILNQAPGILVISNSTISSNRANGGGGGIANTGIVLASNVTVSANRGGSGLTSGAGWVTLQNSIVANNEDGNCEHGYGSIHSNGYNLSSDSTGGFDNTGDLNSTDPKVGQFGYHGGPTETVPLLPGSPAIDAGNPSGCTDFSGHLLKTDQRGKPRPDKEDTGGCDVGAYERQK